MKPIVYIVHHVDTEGPLYEDIKATFERVELILGTKVPMKPTRENLKKLQEGTAECLTEEQRKQAQIVTKPHLLEYKKSWAEVDEMLYRILSKDFRNKYKDSFGGGYVFNWHVMNHVGFITNPRHRDMGYLNIFDHYQSILDETDSLGFDEVEWHFHPVPFEKRANQCATSYDNSYPILHQILCRRLVERGWFPRVNRPGMHTIRPDSNWFLEQWIPFDAGNQSIENDDYCSYGRYGDWKGAPNDWGIYHPDIYDWRKVGSCNRYISRVLNLNTRFRNLTEEELKKAFEKAKKENKNVYMGVTDHDFRELSTEIDEFYQLLMNVKESYPDVDFKFSKTLDAFRNVIGLPSNETVDFETTMVGNRLEIRFTKGEPFGPQPYLAIKTIAGEYLHDNFDFGDFKKVYYYTFDADTIDLYKVDTVVVATNDNCGNQCIKEVKIR